MTEKQIQLLGFEINYDDGFGSWDKYHYYSYEVARGLEFISNASDEVDENGEWFIEFLETDPTIRFYKMEEVQALINTLEKHIVKK
jgi:hypothetical protein